MSGKLEAKPILGCTDSETVKLDCDNMSLKDVKYWAKKAMDRFKLEGFIALKSSDNNYHVVFNRPVSWDENMQIVAWVALLSNNPMLQKWHLLQCIKRKGSTLRVSAKGDKPSPRVVYRYGRQDKMIREFLEFRRKIKGIGWDVA